LNVGAPAAPGVPRAGVSTVAHTVRIPVVNVALDADVVVPDPPSGTVLFAHGSGSSRASPRNRAVAAVLQHAGFATVLTDLLTEREARADSVTGTFRFDLDLLAGRLIGLVDWLWTHEPVSQLPIGLFGASTGSAGAIVAAAGRGDMVRAVVSRGGRPDLAREFLPLVRQPTLLLVGALDEVVLDLNREALRELRGEAQLEVVPGATHLFEEPGAMERVAQSACAWFTRHVPAARPSAP
jgi:pimeloyl-ACP methyl ester carboxylesterase